MTLFEKIYFTVAIFNAFLAVAGATIKIVYDDDRDKIGEYRGEVYADHLFYAVDVAGHAGDDVALVVRGEEAL